MRIAYFITPHGFGHAARACAVMSALFERYPQLEVDLFTRVPRWFFEQSCPAQLPLHYHEIACDVGFIQASAISEDYDATIAALARVYPFAPDLIEHLAMTVRSNTTRLVLCDVAPMGIVVAQAASIPSVLIENFTWDMMYSHYLQRDPRFEQFIRILEPLFKQATVRIQCEPPVIEAPGAARVAPIARTPRGDPREVRRQLDVPEQAPLIVCSMGGAAAGVSEKFPFASQPHLYFALAGVSEGSDLPENVRIIPQQTRIYHPDLMLAADAVIGKVGYSTVAEAYNARTQFLFIPRPLFAESAVIERFVTAHLNGAAVAPDEESFVRGEWVQRLSHLLRPVSDRPRLAARQLLQSPCPGAVQVADLLGPLLDA